MLCLCGYVSSDFFQIATFIPFSPILKKLGTHVLRANTQKNCGTDFQSFAFEIFGEFLKFYIRV